MSSQRYPQEPRQYYPNNGSQSPNPQYGCYPGYPQPQNPQYNQPSLHGHPNRNYYCAYRQQQQQQQQQLRFSYNPYNGYNNNPQSALPARAPHPYALYMMASRGIPMSGSESGSGSNGSGLQGPGAASAADATAGHQAYPGINWAMVDELLESFEAEDALKNETHEEGKDDKQAKTQKKEKRRVSSSHEPPASSSQPPPPPIDYSSAFEIPNEDDLGLLAPPEARGNFTNSSKDIVLKDNVLTALCCDGSGRHFPTTLPLNKVLANVSGRFEWKVDGHFGDSATNVRLFQDGSTLEAELADGCGGWKMDWVWLDERIMNQNGELTFLAEEDLSTSLN